MIENVIQQIKNKEKATTAYRTIGEVATILEIPQHILRFWESKFEQITPQKNKGRRYYSPDDIYSLKKIKHLLYEQGFTIKGVKQYLENSLVSEENIKSSSQMDLISNENLPAILKKNNLIKVLELLHKSKEKLLSIRS